MTVDAKEITTSGEEVTKKDLLSALNAMKQSIVNLEETGTSSSASSAKSFAMIYPSTVAAASSGEKLEKSDGLQ